MLTDHLTRAASLALATATLFCVATALTGAVAARGAAIEQLPPRPRARVLEGLTVAQSQGGVSCVSFAQKCFATRMCINLTCAHVLPRQRDANATQRRVSPVSLPETPLTTPCARLSRPARNLLERETHRRETDPFRACAVRALRGEWGELPDWKRDAYEWGLENGLTVPEGNKTKITSYGPWEPCGTHTFSGERATTQFVSVDPKHVPLGAIIWTPWGLRYAMDTGGVVKVQARYLRRGENNNVDYFTKHGIETEHNQPWVIVKTKTDWNWYGVRKWRDWSRQGPCPARLK